MSRRRDFRSGCLPAYGYGNYSTHRHASDKADQRIQAGTEGERALGEWFSQAGLGYIAVCQHWQTFAAVFTGSVKRPDFLLLFDSLGLIAVDAKNIKRYEENGTAYYKLYLDAELKRSIAFERAFRMPIWYAVKGDEKWYWISALKAVEVGIPDVTKGGKNFVRVAIKDFIEVSTEADLSKLYNQRVPSHKGVASVG